MGTVTTDKGIIKNKTIHKYTPIHLIAAYRNYSPNPKRIRVLPEEFTTFTGKELDSETGFYYYGARYLDPKTSRWISATPPWGTISPVRR
jgi:RHS repeat-associated protein